MTTTTDTASQAAVLAAMKGALARPEATDPMGTLATAVAGARNADGAHFAVQYAAAAEVTTRQWQQVELVIDHGTDAAEALRRVRSSAIRDVIGRGADDTWSGRGNDLKRVRFDALLQWIEGTGYLLPDAD